MEVLVRMGILSAWLPRTRTGGHEVARDANPCQPESPCASPVLPSSEERGIVLLDEGVEGRQPRLPPAKAAAVFVDWMQRRGDTGITTSRRIQALYSRHCFELNVAELPPNVFLRELSLVAPRSCERVHCRDGARSRAKAYCIPTPVIPNKLSIAKT